MSTWIFIHIAWIIEIFRKMSLQIVNNLRNEGGFPDASPKPK